MAAQLCTLGLNVTSAEDAATTFQSHPQSQRAPTNGTPCDAVAAGDQDLRAALRRIDALRAHEEVLERRIAKLERALLKARESAYHDELTGLPNRRLLLDRFNRAVARGARRRNQVAMLLFDLDGFKSINDAFGHAAGDNLLRQVARRLAACLRASDTACRFGGDEFLSLLPELESKESALAAAGKIRARLAMPYLLDGTALRMTASIGMAIYPVDGKEYGELIQHADQAMYRDKARGAAPPSGLECGSRMPAVARIGAFAFDLANPLTQSPVGASAS